MTDKSVSTTIAALAFLVVCSRQPIRAQVQVESKAKAEFGSIAGRVTIQGRPASGLVIQLMPTHEHIKDAPVATAVTGDQGQYLFREMPASHYYVKVEAPEYFSEELDRDGPGRRASLATGQTLQHIDIDLSPGGIISGRIVDQDGFPVRDEAIHLIRPIGLPYPANPVFLSGRNQTTDYDGTFRVTGIRPGSYWIAIGVDIGRLTGDTHYKHDLFVERGRVEGSRYFEQTFYPGVTDRAQAQAVEIKSGEEVGGLSMNVSRPHRAYSVTGRVVNQSTGGPITLCYLEVGHIEHGGGAGSSYRMNGPSDTDANGQFKITGLMPGRFFVRVHLPEETRLNSPTREFDIGDKDISDFEIRVGNGVTVSGSVAIEGEGGKDAANKFAGLKLKGGPRENILGSAIREASVTPAGSFAITGLSPGKVAISIWPSGWIGYFDLLRIEYSKAGQDSTEVVPAEKAPLTSEPTAYLSLPDEGIKNLRVVLAYHNGAIKCHVNFLGGELPIDNRYSVNITHHFTEQSFWTTDIHLDPDGNASRDGLEPGEYELCLTNDQSYINCKRKIVVEKNKETRVSLTVNLK